MKPLPKAYLSSQSHEKSSPNELLKSIQELGKSIDMPTWEIQEFIQICTKLKYLKMGRDVLQDYQKLRQDIYKLIEKRRSYMMKSFQILSPEGPISNIRELMKNITKLAEYSLKSWIAISRLRQLQWCPHPIKIMINDIPTPFLVEYQSDTALLLNKIQQKGVLFSDPHENWIYFLVLVTTSGLQQFDLTTLRSLFDHHDSFDTLSAIDTHQFYINLMKEIILNEFRCQEIKDIFNSLPDESSVPIIQSSHAFKFRRETDSRDFFPILRLQYDRKLRVEDSAHDSELNTTDLYIEGAKILLYYFYSQFAKTTKRETSDPHMIHSNNLARINEEFVAYNKRPVTPLSSRIYECEKKYQPKEKNRFPPSSEGQKKNRPQSSPLVSSKKTSECLQDTGAGNFIEEVVESQKSPRRVDLNSSSHDENTVDMYRASRSSPVDCNLETLPKLTPVVSNSDIRKEYEDAGILYDRCDSQHSGDQNQEEEIFSPKQSRQKRSLTAPPQLSPLIRSYSINNQRSQANVKPLQIKKSDSWNTLEHSQIPRPKSPQSEVKSPPMLRPLKKKETLLQTKICAQNGNDLSLDISRVKFATGYRLLIIGYTPNCSLATKSNCLIGDEVLAVNDVNVEGKHHKDITRALIPIGRGGMSPLKGHSSPLNGRRPSSAVSNPMVNIQLRRYYPDWEKYAVDGSSAPITHEANHMASPVDISKSSNQLNLRSSSPTILLEYEKRIEEMKNDIQKSEERVLDADVSNFLALKEILLRKYDELREIQEAYFEIKIQAKLTTSSLNEDNPVSNLTCTLKEPFFAPVIPEEPVQYQISESPNSLSGTEEESSESTSHKVEIKTTPVLRNNHNATVVEVDLGSKKTTHFDSPDKPQEKVKDHNTRKSRTAMVATQQPANPRLGKQTTPTHKINKIQQNLEPPASQNGKSKKNSKGVPRPSEMFTDFDEESFEGLLDETISPKKATPISTVKIVKSPQLLQHSPSFEAFTPSSGRIYPPSISIVRNKRSNVVALRETLQIIKLKYKSSPPRLLAKMKIYAWWKLIYPQRQLEHRLWIRDVCLEWLYEVFDAAYDKTIRARRIRRNMLREAAATKIQNFFRHWKATVLSRIIRIQRAWRRYNARKEVWRLINITRAAVRVARFLYRRRRRLNQPVGKKILYRRVIRSFIEIIGFRIRDSRSREVLPSNIPAHLLRKTVLMNSKPRRNDLYQRREKASTKIQSLFLMRLAKKTVTEMRRERDHRRQFVRTMVIVRLKRKMQWRFKKIQASTLIASFWRGCSLRWKLMIRVLAGIKITSCWRKYKEYWKLKRCLRRNEVPVNIVLHGIKNIPSSQIHSKSIKVRVSVWWTALLHLVGESDFETVIMSKPPNIVRTTSYHPCVEQTRPNIVPSLSPASSFSSLHDHQNEEKTQAPLSQPPIVTTAPTRRLSLAQQTQILTPHESCRVKSATEQLVEFARLNGVQGAAIKVSATEDRPKPISSNTRKHFVSAVKRTLVVRNLSKLDESDKIVEEESSSSSSSSSSDENSDDELDKVVKKNSSKKKSDSVPMKSFGPKHRLSFDCIGRESVNSLGTYLLPEVEIGDQTSAPAQLKGALTGLSSMQPHRNSISVAPQTPTPGFINNALNVFKGTSFTGLFESPSNVETFINNTSLKYSVSLDDESLYIPGCHGNSVIRFDYYSGSTKFGTTIYQLSSDKSLMFWGGEMTQPISMTVEKTLPRVSQQSRSNSTIKGMKSSDRGFDVNGPTLELKIAAGAPTRSRCGWCMVSVTGNGPLKRRMRTKGFLKSFFETWDHLYVSLDGEYFSVYPSRNAPEPLLLLALSDIKNIRLDLADNHHTQTKGSTSNVIEDKFVIVLAATTRDIIKLRFQDPFARETWVRIFVQAIDYQRDILSKRLLANPMLSMNVSSTSRSNASDNNKNRRR